MRRTVRKSKDHKIRNMIFRYIEANLRSYFILLVIFFIGLILGVIFVNNSNVTQSNQISNYINNFINSIKENYQISTSKLLWNSIINNTCICIILWFLGSTVVGMPLIYLVIGYKAYCIGYTVSAVIATIGVGKGILFIISTMLLR